MSLCDGPMMAVVTETDTCRRDGVAMGGEAERSSRRVGVWAVGTASETWIENIFVPDVGRLGSGSWIWIGSELSSETSQACGGGPVEASDDVQQDSDCAWGSCFYPFQPCFCLALPDHPSPPELRLP